MTDDELNYLIAKDMEAGRCPCSFQHAPHDNCDGNPGAKFGGNALREFLNTCNCSVCDDQYQPGPDDDDDEHVCPDCRMEDGGTHQ